MKEASVTLVYVIGTGYGGGDLHKIGVTNDITRRLHALQGGNPYTLFVACNWELAERNTALDLEAHLLGRFPRMRGEWVRAVPREIRLAGDAYLGSLRAAA
jgi:hypothetical protein